MAELVADAPRPSKRSRSGCDECRRRHWKCDEAKPTCAFCQSASRVCVYARQLSWGGRPFKRSRFGKCLDSEAQLVSIAVSRSKCHVSHCAFYADTSPKVRQQPEVLSTQPLSQGVGVQMLIRPYYLLRTTERTRNHHVTMKESTVRLPNL